MSVITRRKAVAAVRKIVKARGENYLAAPRYVSVVMHDGVRTEASNYNVREGHEIVGECVVGTWATDTVGLDPAIMVGSYDLADELIRKNDIDTTRGARAFLHTVQRYQDGRLDEADLPFVEAAGGTIPEPNLMAAGLNRQPWGVALRAAEAFTSAHRVVPRQPRNWELDGRAVVK